VLITLTDCPSEFETHTHFPLGLTAMLQGPAPTDIGCPGVDVARSIGVTVLELKLLTYAVAPLGVMAIAAGPPPTRIGFSRVNEVEFSPIGVTVFEFELVT
jgi:hypothetical protein